MKEGKGRERKETNGISIPIFEELVFTDGKEVVSVWNEFYIHNRIIMREYGFMTVSKIQTPQLYILIRRSSGKNCFIR